MFNTYTIDKIADDCWDLYVSDDDGYTWEYYGSYEREEWAREDAEAAIWRVERESYISHGK